jgi:hypothetical protein
MTRRLPLFLLLFCVAGFGFGLLQLFRLRFEVGDVYPAYSSLRSDPLGAMAFYESLEQMPGLSVSRDFSAANQLPEGKATTYLQLAAQPSEWRWLSEGEIKTIEGFLARGGRLAVVFFPQTSRLSRFADLDQRENREEDSARKKRSKSDRKASPPSRKQKQAREDDENLLGGTSLKERWGVEFGFAPLSPGQAGSYDPAQAVNRADLPLPSVLDWHSATIFTNLDVSWQTIYARGANPVLIERRFGSGSVVLATDCYFLSNEAMLKDRHADLLSWLVGPVRQVVFDESHFGLLETSGVAALVLKYRLHGLVFGLLLLATLFIWKNSIRFAPAGPEEAQASYVPGKDAAAGFVNLLRRNIPASELLGACFEEWKKSFTRGGVIPSAKLAQAHALIEAYQRRPPRERDPVRSYQELCRILKGPVS